MAHHNAPTASDSWLRNYYLMRGLVSVAWIAAAVAVGLTNPAVAAILLVAYPAWDAIANFADARRSGGLAKSPSQTFNMVVSLITAIAVAAAVGASMNAVLAIFGIWASLSGILQLVTGVRRWKQAGAQWAMILSGAQSTLAGGFFLKQAFEPAVPNITAIAPYAAFGAFYFLLSAILLTVSAHRRGAAAQA